MALALALSGLALLTSLAININYSASTLYTSLRLAQGPTLLEITMITMIFTHDAETKQIAVTITTINMCFCY